MAEASTDSSTVSIFLHPLVIINVSDHFTRAKCENAAEAGFICGALIGSYEGRRLDIHNSFDLQTVDAQGRREIDKEFFQTRLSQYHEVFPAYDFIGWYGVGSEPSHADLARLKEFEGVNENPFFLLLNPTPSPLQQTLPVRIFERVLHNAGGQVASGFNEVTFRIETGEAERIAVSHVAKAATSTSSGYTSDYTSHLSSLSNAVGMLSTRIETLHDYVQGVRAGHIPKDHAVLRELLAVCNSIAAAPADGFHHEFLKEFVDSDLVVLLNVVTTTMAQLSGTVDEFLLAYERKPKRAGAGHAMF